MLEILFWIGMGLFIMWYLLYGNNREDEIQQQYNGFSQVMSLKNAILVLPLKDIDGENTIYYVGECHNPESTVSHDVSLSDFIFNASVFENLDRAREFAMGMSQGIRTRYGVIFYNNFANLTFGQVMLNLNRTAYT